MFTYPVIRNYFLKEANRLVETKNDNTQETLLRGLILLNTIANMSKESKFHSPFLRTYLPKEWRYDTDNLFYSLTNHMRMKGYRSVTKEKSHLKQEENADGVIETLLTAKGLALDVFKAIESFFADADAEDSMFTYMLMLIRAEVNPPFGLEVLQKLADESN